MLLATAIYIPLFPPAFGLLGKKRLVRKLEEENVEMDEQKEDKAEVTEKSR